MDNKEILKKTIKPIIYLVMLLTIVIILRVRTPVGYVATIVFLKMFFDFLPTLIEKARSYIVTMLVVSIFFVFLRFLGAYGIIGLILSIIVMALFRIWRSWDVFLGAMQSIEKLIFGRVLNSKEEVLECEKNGKNLSGQKEALNTYEEKLK